MSDSKPKKKKHVSPAGVGVWLWVNKPDTKFKADGVFHAKLRWDEGLPEYTDLQEQLDEYLEVSKQEALDKIKPAKKKTLTCSPPYFAEEDEEGDPTGNMIVRFKQNAKIRRKDGTVSDVKLNIFDAKGIRMPKPPLVYGGSIVKIGYTVRSWYSPKDNEYGISLDMGAVFIIDLVSADAGSAGDWGYEADEDGYDGSDYEPSDDADPSEGEGSEEEADF